MSVDVWEPGGTADHGVQIQGELLRRLVDCAREELTTLDQEQLQAHRLADESRLMGLEPGAWETASELSTEDIERLVRFFTLVEMKIAGWEGGRKSPVIPLVRMLKSREAFTAELRKWIKANTSNRYLPNGSAL